MSYSFSYSFFLKTCALATLLSPLSAEAPPSTAPNKNLTPPTKNSFEPFTGCIRRNKVRMRIGADVNSSIVSELSQGVLLSVVGEQDDFYAVRPPQAMKVYVYRTYILNQNVDASRVNLRLTPSMDGPIVGQLHKGDRVDGQVYKENDQWVEMNLPDNMPLYISKEFIEKAGPPSYLAAVQARRGEALEWIRLGEIAAQKTLESPRPGYSPNEEIDLSHAYSYFNKVRTHAKDFPDLISRADQLQSAIDHAAAQKKDEWREYPRQPIEQLQPSHMPAAIPHSMPESMACWIPREQMLFEEWRTTHSEETITAFYAAQQEEAVNLKGIIQPYTRSVQNRPGNFLLIHPVDGKPIAFLYSTQVNLQEHVGSTLSLLALPRPNHHFAFPAFFVFSIL